MDGCHPTYGVHFDPFDARRIFISYTASVCSAARRRRILAQLFTNVAAVGQYHYWVEFDPKSKGLSGR